MTPQDPRDRAAGDPPDDAARPEHRQASGDRSSPGDAASVDEEPKGASSEPPRQQPPARPQLHVGPVLAPADDVPGQLTTSFWLWIASFLAGLTAAAVATLRFDSVAAELEGRIQQLASAEQLEAMSPEEVTTLAETILLSTLAAIAVLVVLQVVLAAAARSGRGWARGVLVATVVVSAPAILVAQDLVTAQTKLGFLLQGALMLSAAVFMFLPDSNAWFRARPPS